MGATVKRITCRLQDAISGVTLDLGICIIHKDGPDVVLTARRPLHQAIV